MCRTGLLWRGWRVQSLPTLVFHKICWLAWHWTDSSAGSAQHKGPSDTLRWWGFRSVRTSKWEMQRWVKWTLLIIGWCSFVIYYVTGMTAGVNVVHRCGPIGILRATGVHVQELQKYARLESRLTHACQLSQDSCSAYITLLASLVHGDTLTESVLKAAQSTQTLSVQDAFRYGTYVLCPIESMDTLVTFVMKIVKNSRWFRRRRAVGFDRASGAIESNCPSASKSSRIFHNFHDNGDESVHTLDGTEYLCCTNFKLNPTKHRTWNSWVFVTVSLFQLRRRHLWALMDFAWTPYKQHCTSYAIQRHSTALCDRHSLSLDRRTIAQCWSAP